LTIFFTEAAQYAMAKHSSFLNPNRPPVFCPGCSHELSLKSLDKAFRDMGLSALEIAIVTDIGCSGLFDTFFNTHAMHGLHGRALTYAAGIKLSNPGLKVIVIMGDGALGIGGAHLLAACRRNLDLTLIILNNFNFGMTGGQFSCTTPSSAQVSSGFLNALEIPMDICSVAASAGAPFVMRSSVYHKNMWEYLSAAIAFEGFSLVDVWGFCPGRYGRKNRFSKGDIDVEMGKLPAFQGRVDANLRPEYGTAYRKHVDESHPAISWQNIKKAFKPPVDQRREVVILGSAGGGVISAGAVLAHAAISAGMHVTQKNEFNITVMRGPSVTEIIISPEKITYTGIRQPHVIAALSREGVRARRDLFHQMRPDGIVILAKGVEIPGTAGKILEMDFKSRGIRGRDQALASLALLGSQKDPVTLEMLEGSLKHLYKGKRLESSLGLLEKAAFILAPYLD